MELRIKTPEVYEPLLQPARYKGAHGGRGCVHADTLIDTPNGQVRIKDFKGGRVYAYKDGVIVEAIATPSLQYAEEQLYEVCLSTGQKIICTDEHKFLTLRGWVELQRLSNSDVFVVSHGQVLASQYLSTLGSGLSALRANVRHYWQTLANCLGDCSLYPHQYGQQPLPMSGNGQSSLQQQDDAQQHMSHVSCHVGAQEPAHIDIPSSSLSRPSSRGAAVGVAGKYCVGMGSYIAEKSSGLLSVISRLSKLFPQKKDRSAQDRRLEEQVSDSGILQGLVKNLRMRIHMLADTVFCNRPYYPFSKVGDVTTIAELGYIRKHSRQKYWDLHVYGLNNYLSNGIVNHNSGKSHFFGELWLEENVSERLDVVCLRETLKSLEFSVKKLLESKIESFNAGAYFTVQDRRILTKAGGVTIFEGMQNHTAESIKSLEGFDRAWFEEAQNASDKSLTMLRPTIRKPGSQMWFGWNPDLATDPIDVLLRGETLPPGAVVVQANYMDNPWLPDELRQEMEYDKRRDPDKYEHVWLGGYRCNSEARVFRNWKIEEFTRPEGTVHRLGADWGFSVDPSVLVRCDIEGNRLYVDYEAHMVGCEIVNLPELFMSVPESEKWLITADSARPETISHMQRNGFPKIRSAIKGAKSLEEGVEFLKSFDIIVHPRCKHLIDELTLYSYKLDPLTGSVLPILADKDNHVIDALRYALEGARRARPQADKAVHTKKHNHAHGASGWMA